MSFPVAPANGQIATVNGIRYVYNATVGSWTRISNAKFTAAAGAPSNPALGDEWYNTNLDILFQYINDGTSSYWVDIQSLGQTGNITNITDSTLGGNIVVGINNTYSIGASNGYVRNIFANTITANTLSVSGNITSANTTTGNITASSNITSANITTGNITASGSITVSGNVTANNYSNIIIATGALTNRSALTIAGNVYGRGGIGYFDALQLTTTYSAATNSNKYMRLNPTGGIEIINSAYTTTLLSLSDAGVLNVSGSYQVAGKQAVNGPAFRAYIDGSQTISSGSQQKVTFGTETFDTNSNFSSSRFTPTVEGYYQLNATVRISGSSGTGEVMLTIWKNGSEYARGTNEQGTEQGNNFYSMQVSDLAYANGTTDYFEIYIQQTSGGNRDTTAGQNISYFSGCMVRGA